MPCPPRRASASSFRSIEWRSAARTRQPKAIDLRAAKGMPDKGARLDRNPWLPAIDLERPGPNELPRPVRECAEHVGRPLLIGRFEDMAGQRGEAVEHKVVGVRRRTLP